MKNITPIEKQDMASIILHSGKMLQLDRITGYNIEEQYLEAEYRITDDCLFYDPAISGVQSWVGFECIAQAIAALSGIEGKEEGKTPGIGFILSVSKMQINIPVINSGNTIVIKVKRLECLDLVFSFNGQVFLNDEIVLEGKLTIMEMDEEQIKSSLIGGKEE